VNVVSFAARNAAKNVSDVKSETGGLAWTDVYSSGPLQMLYEILRCIVEFERQLLAMLP